MHRPNIRHPSPGGMGTRPGGFRSPTSDNGGGMFPSPPWGYRGGRSPSFGPRYGQFGGSPNSPGDFGGNGNRGYGGSGGKYHNNRSPMHSPRRQNASSPRGGPPYYRHAPYQSHSPAQRGPAQRGQGGQYQGSPRTSSPYGRERGAGSVEKYYSPSMLQDPWASLQPVAVTGTTPNKGSSQQTTQTGRQGRYF